MAAKENPSKPKPIPPPRRIIREGKDAPPPKKDKPPPKRK